MDDVIEQVMRLEQRLERLLAGGWRNAGADAAALGQDAEDLAGIGMTDRAARVRAVPAAGGAGEAVEALTLASAACQLLRARLAADAALTHDWTPLEATPATPKKQPAVDRLLPVGRMALEEREGWACLRLRGTSAHEWLLVDPLPDPPRIEVPLGRIERLRSRLSGSLDQPTSGPWLRRVIQGRLRWRGRYPLGASGVLQRCGVESAIWHELPKHATLAPLETLGQDLRKGDPFESRLVGAGQIGLTVRPLGSNDPPSFAWPDAALRELTLIHLRQAPLWGLVWDDRETSSLLALIEPGSSSRPAHLLHLLPGAVTDILR